MNRLVSGASASASLSALTPPNQPAASALWAGYPSGALMAEVILRLEILILRWPNPGNSAIRNISLRANQSWGDTPSWPLRARCLYGLLRPSTKRGRADWQVASSSCLHGIDLKPAQQSETRSIRPRRYGPRRSRGLERSNLFVAFARCHCSWPQR